MSHEYLSEVMGCLETCALYTIASHLRQYDMVSNFWSGGSAVARKLISLYFSLFKLILEGKIGQAHELQVRKEAQEAQKPGKQAASKKKRWKERPQGQAAPKSAEKAQMPEESQVSFALHIHHKPIKIDIVNTRIQYQTNCVCCCLRPRHLGCKIAFS